MDSNNTVNISTITVLKVIFIGLLLWFMWAIREVLLLLVISIIISSAIDPLADWLAKRKIPRGLSVFFVYIMVLGMFVAVGMLMAPAIGHQFQELAQSNVIDEFQSKLGVFRDSLNESGIGRSVQENIKSWAEGVSSTVFNTTKGVFTGLLSIITVMTISFYLTVEENGMKNFIKHLTPFKHQAYTAKLITKIQRKMGYWVLGQVILSAVIFGLTYIGLVLLKVEYALVLALIAGVLEIIPYIGPFLALIPALLFAFIQSPGLAIAVVILYVVIQQLENHVIVPVVMSKSVGLNPVLVILGILVGGILGGILGAVIAIPVLSAISIFVSDMLGVGEAVADE